ncbi:unnamed protein product [Aspergillus oryzae]|uniref:Unnamed protein product n=1 Tax=Aspergillus oryzae TaxID=5062 RepID=A0AAN4YNV0_ASPOZ|nr:unnamed protein product [Aspergillus oryzae]
MCSVLLLPRPDALVTTQKPPDPCSTILKLRDKTWVNSSSQFIAPKHLTFMVRPLQQLTLDPCCFRSHTTAPLPTQDLLHTSKFPAAIHIVLVNRDTYNVNILLGLVIRQTILLVAEQHEIYGYPKEVRDHVTVYWIKVDSLQGMTAYGGCGVSGLLYIGNRNKLSSAASRSIGGKLYYRHNLESQVYYKCCKNMERKEKKKADYNSVHENISS